MKIDETLKTYVGRSGVARVRNAVNVLLWPLPLLLLSLVLSISFAGPETWITKGLFGLSALNFAAILSAYVYWARKEPDRLQSEEYYLALQQLSLLERKGGVAIEIDDKGTSSGKQIEMEFDPRDPAGDLS